MKESDQKWGVTKYSFLECLREGIPRRLGSTPLWHVAIWCAPDWLKNTAGWRLFQLVVVVARRKDNVRRQTDQRPRPAQTNVISIIRDQHITRLGSVITAYTMMRHDESSRSRVTSMSRSHAAPSAPSKI